MSRRAAREGALLVGMAVVLAVLLRTFVAQAFSIPSDSMLPQLRPGDRVVVSRLAYDLHDPRRGDIVVFDNPLAEADGAGLVERAVQVVLESVGLRQPSTEEFIKRVVALPGEVVEGRDGRLVVDGRVVVEPYLPDGTATPDFEPVEVPGGRLFVLGDNRGNSLDSEEFGPIRADSVVGRAVVRLWPPGRTAFL